MASTVLFVNQKGEEVVARHFRNDVPRTAIDTFRNKVGAPRSRELIVCLDNERFLLGNRLLTTLFPNLCVLLSYCPHLIPSTPYTNRL